MAITIRGKTCSYDNVSVGNATGRERTILAQTPSTEGMIGGTGSSTDPIGATSGVDGKGGSNLAVGSVNNTSDPLSNISAGVVCLRGERLG